MADKVTLSTLNTRSGARTVSKVLNSHSGYWLSDFFDDGDFDLLERKNDNENIERALRLNAVKSAVSNFVRILTNNPAIQVTFTSKNDSYTDGKRVTISAVEDPTKFDSMVGLALHEAAHCVLTDILFYQYLCSMQFVNQFSYDEYESWMMKYHPVIRKKLEEYRYSPTKDRFVYYSHLMLNLVEDRRIDQYIYQRAMGYRPYYEAMYDRYFLSREVTKGLREGMNEPTLDNYVNRLINVMNPAADPDALPGLRKLYELFDVRNIARLNKYAPTEKMQEFIDVVRQNVQMHVYHSQPLKIKNTIRNTDYNHLVRHATLTDRSLTYDLMPPAWKLSQELLVGIMELSGIDLGESETPTPINPSMTGDSSDESEDESKGGFTDSMGNESDMGEDGDDNSENDTQTNTSDGYTSKKLEKELAEQRKFVLGDVKKKNVTDVQRTFMSQLESADSELATVDGKGILENKYPCIIIRKVTPEIVESAWFPFGSLGYKQYNQETILEGIRMGQILAARLQVRNDPQITHYTRQEFGRVDRRMLANLGMDITSVFKRTRTDQFKPALLYLTVDASGSMRGDKWRKTMIVATALSYMADRVPSIDVVVTIRGGSKDDLPMVAVIHDSRKQKFAQARQVLELLVPNGGTPESLCYEATMNYIMENEKKSDVYFINFSDGEPGFSCRVMGTRRNSMYYGGELAVKHTRHMMNMYREAGVRILSYFISDVPHVPGQSICMDERARVFRRMYGDTASFVDVKNATSVVRTLQELLSDRSGMVSTLM